MFLTDAIQAVQEGLASETLAELVTLTIKSPQVAKYLDHLDKIDKQYIKEFAPISTPSSSITISSNMEITPEIVAWFKNLPLGQLLYIQGCYYMADGPAKVVEQQKDCTVIKGIDRKGRINRFMYLYTIHTDQVLTITKIGS